VGCIQSDLNLTSTTSTTRIGGWVNRGYRSLCTDLGIQTIAEVLGVQVSTVIGNQELTWGAATTTPVTNVEKILRMYDPLDFTPGRPIIEVSVDEIRNSTPATNPCRRWALLRAGASSVTVLLDSVPATSYALTADVMANQSTLSGSAVPAFAEDFHDLLIYYGKWQELKKMQNYTGAKEEEIAYHGADGLGGRLSELRLFLALSAHKKVYQGKTGSSGYRFSVRI
jgi:hypothetical protein